MTGYVIRRLLLMIPTFLLVTLVVFLCVRFIPGDIVEIMVGEIGMDALVDPDEVRKKIRTALGLDVPIHIQYGRWVSGMFLHGSLGISLRTQKPVLAQLVEKLPVSLELGGIAVITALLIAVPIGVFSAVRQDTWGDYAGRTVAIVFICLPSFWLGTMIVVYPSIWWAWVPALEFIPFSEDPKGNLIQFLIPGGILGMVLSGSTMRMTRTMMLEVLRQDYIRTAWSKGLKERIVIFRHAMKNALIPVVTIVGLLLPVLIGGTVIVEQIFSLPGMGRLLMQALNQRDYPMLSGLNVFLATFVLIVNLLIDLTYAWLDPRVHYRKN